MLPDGGNRYLSDPSGRRATHERDKANRHPVRAPEWFAPLFAELDRRGIPYARIPAHEHHFDPAERSAPYSLVVNRVSPSSYLRDHTGAIFHAQQYLAHLEEIGVPVVNGSRAYALEISKARQLSLLAALGVPHPRSWVVNHPGQVGGAGGPTWRSRSSSSRTSAAAAP